MLSNSNPIEIIGFHMHRETVGPPFFLITFHHHHWGRHITKNATLSIIFFPQKKKNFSTAFPIHFLRIVVAVVVIYIWRVDTVGWEGVLLQLNDNDSQKRFLSLSHFCLSDGSHRWQCRAKVSRLPAGGKTDYILHGARSYKWSGPREKKKMIIILFWAAPIASLLCADLQKKNEKQKKNPTGALQHREHANRVIFF